MKNLRIDVGLIFRLLKKSGKAFMDDNALRLSAALSYYSIFSIAPLLLIAVGIVGIVFKQEAAQGKITEQLSQFIGWQASQSVEMMVSSAGQNGSTATVIGFVFLLFGASTVFGQLKEALNTIWAVRPKPGLGIWGFVRERLASFSMVLVIGFLLLVSLALSAAILAMNQWMEAYWHLPKAVSGIFGFFLPLSVETVLFALVYKILPDVKIRWRCVWLGAVVTAIFFEIGKTLLAFFFAHTSSTSGAAGSVVALLSWIYYASAILFFGAEFTKVYAEEANARIEPSDVAERAPTLEGMVAGAAAKVGVQRNPLHPDQPVPALPMKESLAPLLATTMIEPRALRPVRIARPIPQTRWEGWMETAREHPVAQIGAAVGVGLLAGAISRSLEKQPPALSAREHFAEGSRKTVAEGRSLLAIGVAWAARHVTKQALRHYGESARESGEHWSQAIAARVEKAMR